MLAQILASEEAVDIVCDIGMWVPIPNLAIRRRVPVAIANQNIFTRPK